MPATPKPKIGAVLAAGRRQLRLTQDEVGAHLGVSGRTIHRWETDQRRPRPRELPHLLRRLHELSPPLAARLASATGVALEAAGIAPAVSASDVAQRNALDAAICAAAEELDVSPRRLRPGVAALLARLREARVSIEDAAAFAEEHEQKARPS
jgi:transcriptional regulator with XRE-family HTH domain